MPQRLFARHQRPLVPGEHLQSFVERGLRILRPPGPERRCPGFEQHQAVARILPAQVRERAQRVGVAALPVIEQDQGELRVGPIFGLRLRRNLFDHVEALFLAAAEPGDVGHQAHRQRQRRHDVAVGADDEAGLDPRGIERERLLAFVIAAPRGPEPGHQTSFDRGDVGGAQAERRAEVEMRQRVFASRSYDHAVSIVLEYVKVEDGR